MTRQHDPAALRHDIPRRRLLQSARRRGFTFAVAALTIAFAIAGLLGPIPAIGGNHTWIGIAAISIEAVVLAAGLAWLALLATSRRRSAGKEANDRSAP